MWSSVPVPVPVPVGRYVVRKSGKAWQAPESVTLLQGPDGVPEFRPVKQGNRRASCPSRRLLGLDGTWIGNQNQNQSQNQNQMSRPPTSHPFLPGQHSPTILNLHKPEPIVPRQDRSKYLLPAPSPLTKGPVSGSSRSRHHAPRQPPSHPLPRSRGSLRPPPWLLSVIFTAIIQTLLLLQAKYLTGQEHLRLDWSQGRLERWRSDRFEGLHQLRTREDGDAPLGAPS